MIADPGAGALAETLAAEGLTSTSSPAWGVRSETGALHEVLVARPVHLEALPCNAAARRALADGHVSCALTALRQHRAFVAALERAGVRCREVPPSAGLVDLTFTRDPVTMTPWGAIGLSLAVEHRRGETDAVLSALKALGVPIAGRVGDGHVEGGDVCLVRDGLVAIGINGERTDEAGAHALGKLFEQRGWRVVTTRFDPAHLHLDTLLTMIGERLAVACRDALDPALLGELESLGIAIVDASLADSHRLGANLLSLGRGRVLAAAGSGALEAALRQRGIDVIAVDLGEFIRCGGGPHCLTMPLARA